jgi:hypothetical protein
MDVDEAPGAGVLGARVVALEGAGVTAPGLDAAGVCWVPGRVPGAGAPPHAASATMAAPAMANGAINAVLMPSSMCRRQRPGSRPEVPFGVAKVTIARPALRPRSAWVGPANSRIAPNAVAGGITGR